ncbi:MAG: PIN domain-containing protein [Saprospiraceae bacterium]|nr:PIN domain-containing protein [Saprospiraceae bacterium]
MNDSLRIVVDTNVLLMALPRKSPYRPIFDAFLSGKIMFLIDNGILNEYLEIVKSL